MHSPFTPQQFKVSRAAAQLSQARVAADLNINRTYLSQFESGKYLFDDATLTRLRDYFAERSPQARPLEPLARTEPPSQIEFQPNRARLRDGFAIPDGADEDQVESLLNEYTQGRVRIADLCAFDLSKSGFLGLWLDQDEAEKRTSEVLALMARNYAIVEELQGHSSLRAISDGTNKKTVLDFVRARLAQV